MAWSRRWLITNRFRWKTILAALAELPIDFRKKRIELIAREEVRPKSARQRALFHAVCSDLALEIGERPAKVKDDIKALYFGTDDEYHTEDLDHEQYGALIESTYAIAADLGIQLPDRRTK